MLSSSTELTSQVSVSAIFNEMRAFLILVKHQTSFFSQKDQVILIFFFSSRALFMIYKGFLPFFYLQQNCARTWL